MTNASFKSVEEASTRWIEEGRAFKDSLNQWLDVIYIDKGQNETEAPEETRKDMGEYVLQQVLDLNKAGQPQKARELFPPDNDGLFEAFKSIASDTVCRVLLLPDHRILAKVNEWHEGNQGVYVIQDQQVTLLEDLVYFGSSADKRWIAKAYEDHIDVTDGLDGPVHARIDYPRDFGPEVRAAFPDLAINPMDLAGYGLCIESINVFGDGKRVLVCAHNGIFILGEGEPQLLHPDFEMMEERIKEFLEEQEGEEEPSTFSLGLHYPNADLSPDDKYISLGSQDSNHLIFQAEGSTYVEYGIVECRSSYPHRTCFNYLLENTENKPMHQVALSSCHFSRSATIALPLENLEKGFTASGIDGDETLEYIDDFNWIFSILPSPIGYYLGANNGYIWCKGPGNVQQWGYLHIGGTVMSMDISEDRQTLVVASSLGQVIVLKSALGEDEEIDFEKNNRKDPFLITNLPFVDRQRYLFLTNQPPMLW